MAGRSGWSTGYGLQIFTYRYLLITVFPGELSWNKFNMQPSSLRSQTRRDICVERYDQQAKTH